MTQEEILADVERMRKDPKVAELFRDAGESRARGESVRWEDLKKQLGV